MTGSGAAHCLGADTGTRVGCAGAAMLVQAAEKRNAVPRSGKTGCAGLQVVCREHGPRRLKILPLLRVVFNLPFAK